MRLSLIFCLVLHTCRQSSHWNSLAPRTEIFDFIISSTSSHPEDKNILFISMNNYSNRLILVTSQKNRWSLSRRIVFSVFVSSQGVPSSTKFRTEVTYVARGLDMTCFYMFKYIGFHFGLPPTVATLPISSLCFLHLRSDKFIHI